MASSSPSPTSAAERRIDAVESMRFVLLSSLLTLVLWFVPYVGMVLYPIRLFVTYIHEICHALAAVLTGGWPHEIEIYLNGAGITLTSGGLETIIASAGYIGTPLVGAALLVASGRRWMVRPSLVGVGAVLALATVWLGGNPLAWIAGLLIAVVLIGTGIKGSRRASRFMLSFLAIQCIMNALIDLKYLFVLSVSSPVATDAQNMTAATGGIVPPVVWTVLWALISLVLLAVSVLLYGRMTAKHILDGDGQPMISGVQQSSQIDQLEKDFTLPFTR